jgi:hypothetical protein
LSEHFEEFGTIVNVKCIWEQSVALVQFATPEATTAALESSKPICGNRFITAKRANLIQRRTPHQYQKQKVESVSTTSSTSASIPTEDKKLMNTSTPVPQRAAPVVTKPKPQPKPTVVDPQTQQLMTMLSKLEKMRASLPAGKTLPASMVAQMDKLKQTLAAQLQAQKATPTPRSITTRYMPRASYTATRKRRAVDPVEKNKKLKEKLDAELDEIRPVSSTPESVTVDAEASETPPEPAQ